MQNNQKKKSKSKKPGSLKRKNARIGLLFVSPWLVGAAVFLLYPLLASFRYALHNIRITPLGKTFRFVGHGNFTQILLADADFPVMLIDYVGTIIISVPIILVFSLIIAILLNQKIRGRGFFRMIFFLPVVIVSGPVMGMLVSDGAVSITSVDMAAVANTVQRVLPYGMGKPIAEAFASMISILWYSGVPILIFIAGLQKIDPAVYEASRIDGASSWDNFWKITLPSVKPMILLSAIYTIVFISSNEQNQIINLIRNNMFSGTQERGYGYASAMAWLYSLAVLILVGLFALLFMSHKDVYERRAAKADRAYRREKRREAKIIRQSEKRRAERLAAERGKK